MKWVYGVMSAGRELAWHEDKEVIAKYVSNYHRSHPSSILTLCKAKKKEIKHDSSFQELYLTEVYGIYIQQMYVDSYRIFYDGELQNFIDKLSKYLTFPLKKKEKKKILEVIELIKRGSDFYTPSLQELNELYWDMEAYLNRSPFL